MSHDLGFASFFIDKEGSIFSLLTFKGANFAVSLTFGILAQEKLDLSLHQKKKFRSAYSTMLVKLESIFKERERLQKIVEVTFLQIQNFIVLLYL